MNKYERISLHGRFKGKKIELAPTEGMDMFQSIADDFMEAIFSMAPGSYLITDESSLRVSRIWSWRICTTRFWMSTV